MTPSFFGPAGEQLLGIHHSPVGALRKAGVLICPPAPQERSQSHPALRKLAEQLARAGFDVLRFDYRGTGDSNGELEDTTPTAWVEDVRRAAQELRDITGVRKLSVVGFRMGALLAARALTKELAIDTLVLWEPVVGVANWMSQLQRAQEETIGREHHLQPPEDPLTVFGLRLPPALFAQWQALDLTDVAPWAARTEVVIGEDSAHYQRLKRTWARTGQAARWHVVAAKSVASSTGVMLGNEALEAIVHLLGERR